MILHWTIRYLDRTGKQPKSGYLYLDTKPLDPVTRAAVELVAEIIHSFGCCFSLRRTFEFVGRRGK
jgi:hypothetical protein